MTPRGDNVLSGPDVTVGANEGISTMRPPYDPYAAKPEVVRSHADTIVTKSTLIGPVNTAFLQQKAAAAENVTGELVDELDEAFKGVSADSDQIAIASAFVAGTCTPGPMRSRHSTPASTGSTRTGRTGRRAPPAAFHLPL